MNYTNKIIFKLIVLSLSLFLIIGINSTEAKLIDLNQEIEKYSKQVRENPKDYAGYCYLAYYRAINQDYEKAWISMKYAFINDPRKFLYNYGYYSERAKRIFSPEVNEQEGNKIDEKIKEYRNHLNVEPEDYTIISNYLYLLYKKGHYGRMIREFKRYVKSTRYYFNILMAYGYAMRNENEKALSLVDAGFKLAMEKDYPDTSVYLSKAILYEKLGKYNDAIQGYQAYLNKSRVEEKYLLFIIERILLLSGDIDRRDLIKLPPVGSATKPSHLESIINWGTYKEFMEREYQVRRYCSNKKYELALFEFEKAEKRYSIHYRKSYTDICSIAKNRYFNKDVSKNEELPSPGSHAYDITLGYEASRSGDYVSALEHLNKAVHNDVGRVWFPEIYLGMALISEKLNRRKDAVKYYLYYINTSFDSDLENQCLPYALQRMLSLKNQEL